MVLDLMEDLGGWNSWRRTFLSVLGVPFPPTTWKVVKITLSVQNLCWKYWFSLLVYCSNLFSALKFVAESRWHVPVPITGIKQNHSMGIKFTCDEVWSKKKQGRLAWGSYTLQVNGLLHFTQILITGASLACIWRVFLEVLFDLDRKSASKPAEADVAFSPNNMVLIFTYL